MILIRIIILLGLSSLYISTSAQFVGFDRQTCLGKYVDMKVKDFKKVREKLLKRNKEIEDCSKCLRDEKEEKEDSLNPFKYFVNFELFDFNLNVDTLPAKTPSYCRKDFINGFLYQYEKLRQLFKRESALAEWNRETNLTKHNSQFQTKMRERHHKVLHKYYGILDKLAECENIDCRQKKILYPLYENLQQLPKYLRNKKSELDNKIEGIYSKAKICRKENGNNKCYHYEPGITKLMAKSRDYNELLWIWKSWRDAIGPKVRNDWLCDEEIKKQDSRLDGNTDLGDEWRSFYDVSDIKEKAEKLWLELKPLYLQLHAYVRYNLHQMYGDKVNLTGPIPAHLLGNIWSMTWANLYNDIKPYKEIDDYQVTAGLKKKNITVMKMFHLADEFYQSMGLPPMPESFWKKSMFVRPKDGHPVVCYASAHDLGGTDVRIKMCAEVSSTYFYVIHHEMGHCQYFLAYNTHQNYFFQGGANPAFHESIGDTIALSVINPKHLLKLGFLEKETDPEKERKRKINFLMSRALEKLTLHPFALSLEKFRWDLFGGDIKDGKINARWWKRRLEYQGITPPIERSEKDFDPAAKYHVAAYVPYIRYFFSHILQFQFYETLCEAADHKGPLYNCDFGGSKKAGKVLKGMLDKGTSEHWKDILCEMTGTCDVSTEPVKRYFKPLHDWLVEENHRLGNTIVVCGHKGLFYQKYPEFLSSYEDNCKLFDDSSNKSNLNLRTQSCGYQLPKVIGEITTEASTSTKVLTSVEVSVEETSKVSLPS